MGFLGSRLGQYGGADYLVDTCAPVIPDRLQRGSAVSEVEIVPDESRRSRNGWGRTNSLIDGEALSVVCCGSKEHVIVYVLRIKSLISPDNVYATVRLSSNPGEELVSVTVVNDAYRMCPRESTVYRTGITNV